MRSFLVGCGFYILSVLVLLLFRGPLHMLAADVFHLDDASWWKIVLAFLIGAKLILVFLLLTPALALHWCGKTKENR
ncbi:hypothetical protein [Taibaiella chishuiensis]|uniref:Uncharacterized protein n=1 Tax=Taibaiella chishuiensis TaxID=1434707 RepID=A0A2P8D1X8_9BACT|nr:hypothetical protein [Taibaiella chishuiensis]PSK91207.1 hypothetical protein B0I18_106219 [Taibaiella chishuiensis]